VTVSRGLPSTESEPVLYTMSGTMSVLGGESFASSMSRDVLQDWLAVLFQENKTKLESGSSRNSEVSTRFHVHILKLISNNSCKTCRIETCEFV